MEFVTIAEEVEKVSYCTEVLDQFMPYCGKVAYYYREIKRAMGRIQAQLRVLEEKELLAESRTHGANDSEMENDTDQPARKQRRGFIMPRRRARYQRGVRYRMRASQYARHPRMR